MQLAPCRYTRSAGDAFRVVRYLPCGKAQSLSLFKSCKILGTAAVVSTMVNPNLWDGVRLGDVERWLMGGLLVYFLTADCENIFRDQNSSNLRRIWYPRPLNCVRSRFMLPEIAWDGDLQPLPNPRPLRPSSPVCSVSNFFETAPKSFLQW